MKLSHCLKIFLFDPFSPDFQVHSYPTCCKYALRLDWKIRKKTFQKSNLFNSEIGS